MVREHPDVPGLAQFLLSFRAERLAGLSQPGVPGEQGQGRAGRDQHLDESPWVRRGTQGRTGVAASFPSTVVQGLAVHDVTTPLMT